MINTLLLVVTPCDHSRRWETPKSKGLLPVGARESPRGGHVNRQPYWVACVRIITDCAAAMTKLIVAITHLWP